MRSQEAKRRVWRRGEGVRALPKKGGWAVRAGGRHALSAEASHRMTSPSVGARFQLTHAPGWRMPSAGACSQMAKTHRCQLPISAVCAYRRNESQQIRYECRYFDDEERERELTSASFAIWKALSASRRLRRRPERCGCGLPCGGSNAAAALRRLERCEGLAEPGGPSDAAALQESERRGCRVGPERRNGPAGPERCSGRASLTMEIRR